jgi:hypothetical protein
MAPPYAGAYAIRYHLDTKRQRRGKEVARLRTANHVANHVARPNERGHRAAKPPGAVHDQVALAEIELYAELMIAAERSAVPLSREAIDRALGLLPTTVGAH